MKESHSKLLVLLESVVFLAPVSLVTGWYATVLASLYQGGLANEPWSAQVVPAFAFAGLVLQGCAWWVVSVFVFRGRAGLASLHGVFVIAIHAGAALSVIGGLSLLMSFVDGESSLLANLAINAFGLPALVPFIHVALERRHAISFPRP